MTSYNAGYDYAEDSAYAVRDGRSMGAETAVAVIAGAALVLLVLIRRGFRGVNVAGVGVSVR